MSLGYHCSDCLFDDPSPPSLDEGLSRERGDYYQHVRTYARPCKIIPEIVSIGVQRPIFFLDRPSLNSPIRTLNGYLEICEALRI